MALQVNLTPFPADFEVWEVHISDAMDRPFELFVRGASTAPNVDLRAVLGHRVTLGLPGEAMLSSVNGIVTRAARRTPEPSGVTVYELHVAPAEWTLTKRRNSRIFQDQTVLQILAAILGEHALATSLSAFSRELPVREYCVQYDETDSDFAYRLLAEEGMASYFEQSAGGRWTLVDDTSLQKPSRDPDTVVHANSANLKPAGLAVLRWRWENSVEPVTVVRRDFDFERPQLTLQHTAHAPPADIAPAEAGIEEYAYEPGRLLTAADGNDATRDAEALRGRAAVVYLETNFAACAGTALHIEGEELAGDFLVTGCELHLESSPSAERRSIVLSATPLATRHRPVHRKRPLIFGTQSARVVGDTPEGTVDVDSYGRVKLEMRWDRRDLWARGARGKGNPTRRVRVAQAWAGPGYGLVTLPRVGDEVLVAYSDGNPDEPVVIGRLHNAVSATPLDLPEADKTKAMWKSQSFGPNGPEEGYNAIVMDDAAGAEVLGIKAQRDYVGIVGRNSGQFVGVDQSLRVGGSQSVQIAGGQSVSAGSVQVRAAGEWMTVAKTISMSATENFAVFATGERLDMSNTKHHFGSPEIYLHGETVVQVVTKNFHVYAGDEIHLQVGGSAIHITAGGIKISSPGPVEVNGSFITLN
jgi:type VI secretion system secreted protein VgrG